jgi:hypothetical protein
MAPSEGNKAWNFFFIFSQPHRISLREKLTQKLLSKLQKLQLMNDKILPNSYS